MKNILIITTAIALALGALALAQGNQAKGNGNGQRQGQGNGGQHQGQGNGFGQQRGGQGGNGQRQGQGNNGQQGRGLSCSMTSETSSALYSALMGAEGEYAAYAMYGAVIDKFGPVEPYVSIQQAEGQHIDALKRQMDMYGISYPPVNPYLGNVDAPDSLEEAAAAWAVGEIANVEMYDELLLAAKDCDNVTRVFTNLRRASADMHLPAFEFAAQNGGTLSPAQMQDLGAEHHNGNQAEGCQEERGQNGGLMGQGQRGQNSGQRNQGRQGQNRVVDIVDEFNSHDSDANGEISKQEFFDVKTSTMTQKAQEGREMKNVANSPAFEDIDTNGDETISFAEFEAFMASHQQNHGRG